VGITILVIDDNAGPIGIIEDAGQHPGDRLKYEVDSIQANWNGYGYTTFETFAPHRSKAKPESIQIGQVFRDLLGNLWSIGRRGFAPGYHHLEHAGTSLHVHQNNLLNGEYEYVERMVNSR
jgi:hypothetical protein